MANYGGRNINVDIETTYEYAGSEFFNAGDFLDYLSYNLNMAKDIHNYVTRVDQIGDLAVKIAQDFVVSNGTYRTGRLHDSIRWEPKDKGIRLVADARDNYGSAYAGHIEYGFVGRDGLPHGPWPFLRPAMRIAAEASTGDLADDIASNILYGFARNSRMQFGRANLNNVIERAGGHEGVQNRVHRAFGSPNRHGMQSAGNANSRRWTKAAHGIDHMKGLKGDESDEGKAIYSSFINRFGEPMSRSSFRKGDLE